MRLTARFLAVAMLAMTLTTATATQVYNSSGLELGQVGKIKCNSPMTCTVSSGKLNIMSGGLDVSSGQFTRFASFIPGTATSGTSTTPGVTTVYLTQVYVNANAVLTGVGISNGATVGTDKYVVALFNSSGVAVANSATAGATTSGADAWQQIAFTATYTATGPGVYWIGLYVNGTTDRFRSIPALGAYAGLAGSATGQTFGTVATVTLPTTFTADKGPVSYLY